jgi:serine/threonine protein kinase
MEVCSNGTLKDYIQTKGKNINKIGKLNCTEAIELFRKIVIGYTSIVDSLFIHRDLKATNILLRSNGDPVIIDFGYCEMIMGKRPMISYNVGSPSYMSLETFSKNRYS